MLNFAMVVAAGPAGGGSHGAQRRTRRAVPEPVGHPGAVADVLRVTRGCAIDLAELEWRFTPSGGPGGQHANRSNTRVELRFDLAGSPSLGPRQRERLVARYGPVLRVVADDERSQARNRALAVERLRARLADGLAVPRARTATRPTRGAVQRRLADKQRRSERKRDRARPRTDDG